MTCGSDFFSINYVLCEVVLLVGPWVVVHKVSAGKKGWWPSTTSIVSLTKTPPIYSTTEMLALAVDHPFSARYGSP